MIRGAPCPHQGHAVLTLGHQQSLQRKAAAQAFGAFHQQSGVSADPADHGFELSQVRRNGGGAGVAAEIRALGIHENRSAPRPCAANELLRRSERALAVVGKHHGAGLIQGSVELRQGFRPCVQGAGLLDIQPDELLVAADDAHLGDGRHVPEPRRAKIDPDVAKHLGQQIRRFIVSGHPDQNRPGSQRCDVEGDIGGASGSLLHPADVDHRNGGFGRDTLGVTMPVAVQHDVADNQNAGVTEMRKQRIHPERRQHRFEIAAKFSIYIYGAFY
jgi:hypothetical protein